MTNRNPNDERATKHEWLTTPHAVMVAKLPKTNVRQVQRVIFLADVDLPAVEVWLAEQQKTTDDEKGIVTLTRNCQVGAIQQFFKWLIKAKRATTNPLVDLEKISAEADDKRKRRILSREDLGRLIDAAKKGVTFRGASGEDRAILYSVAVQTGLRAGECASGPVL